ncbi:MAG: hypothetical protein ACW98I_12970 [Candidatus Hodarchaeales archaeon]|jgi:hypothetical protein
MCSSENKLDLWHNWSELEEKLFPNTTLPFYQKWQGSEHVLYIESYIKNFHSLLISIEGINVLLPKKLILYEAMKSSDKLYDRLLANPTFEEFRKTLLTISGDLNIRIRKTDYKIIQRLANPNFSKSLDRFPKMKELAYGTRQDVRTVTSRLQYLIKCDILSVLYSIDMAKIGYQTIAFFHKTSRKNIPANIQEYISFYFPIPEYQAFISIIQYPYSDSSFILKIDEIFGVPYEDFKILQRQYRGWNLGGLTMNPMERWNQKPPLLELGGTWQKDLILGKTGIESNLDPLFEIYNLSHTEAQLLGLIQLYSIMDDESLGNQLKRPKKAVVEDWKNLLRNRVIYRFPVFSNIGLGSWIFIYISSLAKSHLRLVLQHFKFFPYANLFINEKEGIVVGCVNIPYKWTHTFLHRIASISEEFPEAKASYYIGPDTLARWSNNIMKTFDWKRFEGQNS